MVMLIMKKYVLRTQREGPARAAFLCCTGSQRSRPIHLEHCIQSHRKRIINHNPVRTPPGLRDTTGVKSDGRYV